MPIQAHPLACCPGESEWQKDYLPLFLTPCRHPQTFLCQTTTQLILIGVLFHFKPHRIPALILIQKSHEAFLPFLCFHTGAFNLGKYTPASQSRPRCRFPFRGAFTVPVARSTRRVGEVEPRRVSPATEDFNRCCLDITAGGDFSWMSTVRTRWLLG